MTSAFFFPGLSGTGSSHQAVESLDGPLPSQEVDFRGSESHVLRNSFSHLKQCSFPSVAPITLPFSNNEFCVMYDFKKKKRQEQLIQVDAI